MADETQPSPAYRWRRLCRRQPSFCTQKQEQEQKQGHRTSGPLHATEVSRRRPGQVRLKAPTPWLPSLSMRPNSMVTIRIVEAIKRPCLDALVTVLHSHSSLLTLPAAHVYQIVRLIPSGHVTSYGHIARLAGSPSHSRMVGSALKYLQDDSVPWQRVIGASGAISERGDGGQGARRQADRLREEGVEVTEPQGAGVGVGGQFKVSLSTYGWCEFACPDRRMHVLLDDALTSFPGDMTLAAVPESVQLDDE